MSRRRRRKRTRRRKWTRGKRFLTSYEPSRMIPETLLARFTVVTVDTIMPFDELLLPIVTLSSSCSNI